MHICYINNFSTIVEEPIEQIEQIATVTEMRLNKNIEKFGPRFVKMLEISTRNSGEKQ